MGGKGRFVKLVASLMLGLGLVMQALAEVPGREDVKLVSVTETVVAVDLDSRRLTLRDARGRLKQVVVADQVKRLDEVAVGDLITLKLYISDLYEVRAPTAAELKQPHVEVSRAARANASSLPGGTSLKQYRSVCQIVELNALNMTGTLLDSQGNLHLVAIKNPENITKLNVGQTVVVTHTEALAVSLEKPTAGGEEAMPPNQVPQPEMAPAEYSM